MAKFDDSVTKLGYVTGAKCLQCGEFYSLDQLIEEQGTTLVNICYNVCLGPLDIVYDYEKIREKFAQENPKNRANNFWKYRELLPVNEVKVYPNQAYTPLVKAENLSKKLGVNLFFKLDSALPTGSFKDRPVTLSVNKALECGYTKVSTASTGNLAISTAAIARDYGIDARVYVSYTLNENRLKLIRENLENPENLVIFPGPYDDANVKAMEDVQLENQAAVKETGKFTTFVPNNSFRPYYKEGSKTSGFEIADQLGEFGVRGADDLHVFYPIGSGALICSAHKGFRELKDLGLSEFDPVFHGVQQDVCDPVVQAFDSEKNPKEIIAQKAGDQLVREIAMGNPGSGYQALDLLEKTGGTAVSRSEKDVLEAFLELKNEENLFPQFVGALTYAGAKNQILAGVIQPGATVVVNITGKGEGRIEDDLEVVLEKYDMRL